ncbi:response regulator [Gemmata sp.]|uniref:response regulator n=1 Tax=Gemmata sp. TaxID=1914242 RepID=UPI003F6F813C
MTATNLYHVSHTLGFFNWFPEASHPTGVLVACADLDNRIGLAHHLEGLGYDVWTAADGADAFEIARSHPVGIDFLVCDADLPGTPAPELFQKLRERHPTLRCCVLATVTHRGNAAAAAEMGAVVLNVGRDATDRGHEDLVSNGAEPGRRTGWGQVTEWSA